MTAPRPWLSPLTPLYRLALALREMRLGSGLEPVCRLRWPVVSIGNLSTGGAGKTPLAIALAGALTRRSLAHGLIVDVLSRGYGRSTGAALRVNPDGTAEQFGDEPLLMAREAGVPVYVAAQRHEAGVLAEADGGTDRLAGVHLLDDGFQHRQLYRDIDILLLSMRDWQDRLLPAGNLREPLSAARRATVIAIPAEETKLEAQLAAWGWQGQLWRVHRRMSVPHFDGAAMAFCGIARPAQFFTGLEEAGIRVAARSAFRDHHRYTATDVERLLREARSAGAAALITTQKDRVRLGGLAEIFAASLPLVTAGLSVEIENEDAALEWLMSRIALLSTP